MVKVEDKRLVNVAAIFSRTFRIWCMNEKIETVGGIARPIQYRNESKIKCVEDSPIIEKRSIRS